MEVQKLLTFLIHTLRAALRFSIGLSELQNFLPDAVLDVAVQVLVVPKLEEKLKMDKERREDDGYRRQCRISVSTE